MDKQSIMSIKNLVTHYGELKVLDGVTFDVFSGEILVILGGSGCGKSTLLKHMVGLLRPTSGEILFRDDDIAKIEIDELNKILCHVGISFQSGGLFNSLTVGENVALPLRELTDLDNETISYLVKLKLSLVGMSHAEHLLPSEISGGMKKRAGLARALALDPEIVFFDEPSAGLDPIMAAGLDYLILQLKKLLGLTVVIVTHELDSIKTIADKIIMLDKGKVIIWDTLDNALKSEIPKVKQFFDRIPDE